MYYSPWTVQPGLHPRKEFKSIFSVWLCSPGPSIKHLSCALIKKKKKMCANLRLHQRVEIKVIQVIRNSVLTSPAFISTPHPAPPSCSQFTPWPHSHVEANAYENGGCFIYVSTFTDFSRLISPSVSLPDVKFHEDRNYLLHALLHSQCPAPSLHGSV